MASEPVAGKDTRVELIDDLCHKVLVNYTINRSLLDNWQEELQEVAESLQELSEIVSHEILIGTPHRNVTPIIQRDELAKFLDTLNEIDGDENAILRTILFEVLECAVLASYTIKVELFRNGIHKIFAEHFYAYLTSTKSPASESRSYISQQADVLVEYAELGGDVEYLKQLMKPLVDSIEMNENTDTSLFITLLGRMLSNSTSTVPTMIFNDFQNQPITIPFASNNDFQNSFTIQFWFKLGSLCANNSTEDTTSIVLFQLASASSGEGDNTLVIKLLINNDTSSYQLAVELYNNSNGSAMLFPFNQRFTNCDTDNGTNHIAITYDSSQRLSLFVDGDCNEYIPCPVLRKSLPSWKKLYIGSTPNDTHSGGSNELVLRNLTILNVALSQQWIAFLYASGFNYDWNYKGLTEYNIVSLMNELQGQDFIDFTKRMNNLKEKEHLGDKIKQKFTHHENEVSVNHRLEFTRKLAQLAFRDDNVLLDFNSGHFGELEAPKNSKILIHKATCLSGLFYGIGGSYFMLRLIEKNSYLSEEELDADNSAFFTTLDVLFSIINKNWRIAREFENISGYGILSVLLTNCITGRSNSFKEHLVLSILKQCGHSTTTNIPLLVNPQAYRHLILNSDQLFTGSGSSLYVFLKHLNALVTSSEGYPWNVIELNKLKLLRKLIHILKAVISSDSVGDLPAESRSELTKVVKNIILVDSSMESIKAITLFIIYLLIPSEPVTPKMVAEEEESYIDVSRNALQQVGVEILNLLTSVLCDKTKLPRKVKRFSRAITWHWILLLLGSKNTSLTNETVVICALRLFTKLLKSLGPNVQKRFFHGSHGKEVLTFYLKEWWSNDLVVANLFRLSFADDFFTNVGSISSEQSDRAILLLIIDTIASKEDQKSVLVFRQLLLILNNLLLQSMNDLSKASGKLLSAPNSPKKPIVKTNDNLEVSLNVLHLLNQMPYVIRTGFRKVPELSRFYTSAEYLEGTFELIAHLRLSLSWLNDDVKVNFQSCYNDWVEVLTEIFFAMINNPKSLLSVLRSLNDITKQIVLDIIFPNIIGHIDQFLSGLEETNHDNNTQTFIEGSLTILEYYFDNFIQQHYYISPETSELYAKCLVSIIELVDSSRSKLHKTPLLTKTKENLGEVIVLRFFEISDTAVGNERSSETFPNHDATLSKLENELNSVIEFILYRQATVFQKEVLSEVQLSKILTILWAVFFKLLKPEQSVSMEYTISFMRTLYMHVSNSFEHVIHDAATQSQQDLEPIVIEFYKALLSQNDSEALKSIHLPMIKKFFMSNYSIVVGSQERSPGHGSNRLKVLDMLSVTLHNGSSLGLNERSYSDVFVQDCEKLKNLIIHTETFKYNRTIQDKEENSQYFISSYNGYKIEFTRLLGKKSSKKAIVRHALDYIENHDSMRKRMILEEHLADLERLSYNVSVPTKQIALKNQSLTYEEAVSGINAITLAADEDDALEADDYEVIKDNGETDEKTDFDDRNRRVLRSLYMGDKIVALWNVSQINGLVPIESLMILGNTHIYLIENYLHCDDGTVVNAVNAPSEIRDPYLQLINSQSATSKVDHKLHRNKNWGLEKLSCVSKRQFLLRDVAMEIFFSDGASVLVTCLSTRDRDAIYSKLLSLATGVGLDSDLTKALNLTLLQQSSNNSNAGSFLATKLTLAFANHNVLEATKKWRMGEISNFYYLMIINTIAGRTYNDLTQYPVFPWVIADYTSETLDLLNPSSYRDLSKPMGAQTQPRANQFKERYEALDSLHDEQAPAFHYGTHYSSAMIVTSYLIRLRPHVQSYLLLQGGKFDHADRLFYSVEKAWNLAAKDNTTDVKELTPEFFYLPEFLTNSNDFDLGLLQNGSSVNDVVLPPWAKGDPKVFIARNREALESPYVSANLHHWIDLIFGFKQSGIEAVKSLNVFHHLSYNGAINLDNIDDEMEKRAVIGAINNFGQTPVKIFHRPHLAKEVLNVPSLYMVASCVDGPPKLLFESKLHLPIKKVEWSTKGSKWVGRPSCITAEDDLLIRKVNHFRDESGSLIINSTVFLGLHDFDIVAITQMGYKQFLTGAKDGVINVWKFHSSKSLHFQSILRGHESEIKAIKYNRSHRTGVSFDASGLAICWDLVRYKFMRKLAVSNVEFIALSEDTGNIATISKTKEGHFLTVFTINGEKIASQSLAQTVTAISFASSNGTMVPSDRRSIVNSHSYWNNEILALAFSTAQSTSIQVLELKPLAALWELEAINHVDISETDIQTVSCIELLKKTEVDFDDRLTRGVLQLVIGDVAGRVYVW